MLINRDGTVTYFPGIFSPHQQYFERLSTSCSWQPEQVKVYGRWHVLSRKTAWYGSVDYRYSGQIKVAQPWLAVLDEIRMKVQNLTGDTYEGVLLNYYPDGSSYIGWHADDERDLVAGAAIASVSFGASRRFDLRHRDGEMHSIDLDDGSVLIMSGELQKHWKHRIPIQKKVKAARVNLTFRVMA
jgi:alkylated DNA repair dioxygenase AlkB